MVSAGPQPPPNPWPQKAHCLMFGMFDGKCKDVLDALNTAQNGLQTPYP